MPYIVPLVSVIEENVATNIWLIIRLGGLFSAAVTSRLTCRGNRLEWKTVGGYFHFDLIDMVKLRYIDIKNRGQRGTIQDIIESHANNIVNLILRPALPDDPGDHQRT